MNNRSQEESGHRAAATGRRYQRFSRWFGAYLILAAFVILTVSGSVLTHRRLLTNYHQSVEVNRLWATAIESYRQLELTITAANAHSNDVFASADPAREADRQRAAMGAYRDSMANVRPVVAAADGLAPDHDWRSKLDEIDTLMTEMSSVTAEVLASYRAGGTAEDAGHMAAMDRLYGEIKSVMNLLQTDAQQLQQGSLEEQLAVAEELRAAEYLIGALVALMVLGLSIYGYRLSGRMTKDDQERRVQLAVIEASERKFRELAEGSIEGITVHHNGKPLFVNQAWADFHGFENPADVIAIEDLSNIVAEENREAVRRIRNSLQGRPGSPRRYEYRAMRTDGSIIWLECLERAIVWQDQPAVQTTAIDISERKQSEDILKAAKLKAEQASESRTRFLAAASHDLRQPLHAISLYLEVLGKYIENPDAEATVEAIRASSDSMRSLLDSLLDISKLDAGMVEANIEAVPILDILDQLAVEAAPQVAEKNIELRVLPSTLWVESDPKLLQRILRNLLSNALRYTSSGRILIGARRHGDRARIEVWDTGPGIPEDQQARIFEEFYQAGQPAQGERPGIGLGLAIIDRLARLLDHDISVRSRLGKGSMFGVEMAIAKPPAIEAEAIRSREFSDGLSNMTVLLIEDSNDVRAATAATLVDWGCEVLSAATIDEAVGLVTESNRNPDVILTDLALREDESGIGAIRHIRRLTGHTLPALIVTAETDPKRLHDVMDSNIVISHKPIEPDALRLALEGLVSNRGNTELDKKTGIAASHSLIGSLN